MTSNERSAAALVAALLGLGCASGPAQEQPRTVAVGEAAQSGTQLGGFTVFPDGHPVLSWQPPRGAAGGAIRYRVRVLPLEGPDRLGQALWEQDGLVAPTVKYTGPPLDSERLYAWAMEAVDAQGRTIAAGGGTFASTAKLFPNLCFPFVAVSASKICKGDSVTLSGFLISSQSGPTTYVLFDGSTSTSGVWPASGLVLQPTTTTPYTLTLKRGTCQASFHTTIVVAAPPSLGPPQADCSPAATQIDPFVPSLTQPVGICCGLGLKCQAGPAVGNVQWTADSAPIVGGMGEDVNVNPGSLVCDQNVDKTIALQATATTDPVCPAVQSTVQVTLYRPPKLSPQGLITVSKAVICADGIDTGQIDLIPPVVGNVTWEQQSGCDSNNPWQPINPPLPFSVGPLLAPDCYRVTVANGSCTPIVQTVRVDIDTPPVAGTITAFHNPICPGDASVLTLTGSSGTVQWYSSTGCTNSTVFASPMIGATGNTVQNTNILQQTTCYGALVSSLLGVCQPVQGPIVPVTVQSLPVAPVVTGPPYICPGQTVMLSSSAPGQWNQNDDPVGPPPFNEPGNYSVAASNICGEADSNILTVKPDLLAVKIQGPCCDCSGGKVQLCATATQALGGPPSLTWSTGAVGSCIKVQPLVTTTYTVTATDGVGCSVSSSFIVTVCP